MKKYILIIVIAFVSCLGLSIFLARPKNVGEEINYPTNIIKIKLEGAIVFPKEYSVISGTKLNEVIALAGGFSEDADTNKLNTNEVLTNSKTISIPFVAQYLREKVNINTAKFEVLLSIPYITEQKAASIIIYRQTYGYFKRIEEIVNVKYIGNATFDKIKDYITI
ncbi:MAG: ComEA family DNA-binding protein [Acholeplasmatales bacterium]|jgi:competence protein ComEA|nr:ComEA family DNA-binding protein [Acholeplasmatales bacterium]